MASKRLAALVRQPSLLWRQVSFKAVMNEEASAARAENFMLWLSPRAAGVKSLVLDVRRAAGTEAEDLSAAASRCARLPLAPCTLQPAAPTCSLPTWRPPESPAGCGRTSTGRL